MVFSKKDYAMGTLYCQWDCMWNSGGSISNTHKRPFSVIKHRILEPRPHVPKKTKQALQLAEFESIYPSGIS